MNSKASKRWVPAMLVTLAFFGLAHLAAGVGPDVLVTSDVVASETWTNDNVYILTKVIYVRNGATLKIEPGTVVRGEPQSATGANDPGTLVVTRGSKILALGTQRQPITFTNLDDDNIGTDPGTPPYDSVTNARSVTGTWGGVIILGRSYVANNTLAGPDPARFFQIEGLTPSGGLGLYGDCLNQGAFPDCDDDDSGVMRYTSIRYGGFNLSDANEINGLTLGAVGRETDFDYVEVAQNKDDGVEFFGGTAEVKHLLVYAVGDDSVDYDEGYRGKIQFGFAMQGLPGTDRSDKGAEQDGGNNPDGSRPFALPTFYNMTFIGHDGEKNFTGSDLNTALHFRDNAGGRQYNSFYADFGGAPLLIEGGNLPAGSQTAANSSGERAITAYPGAVDPAFFTGPASDFQLELQDNSFWCFGAGGVVPSGDTTVWGGDAGKNHYNNGAFTNAALDNDYLACNTPLPIRQLVREANLPTVPDPVLTVDPRPAPGSGLLVTDRLAPADGFFEQAPYKGAFDDKTNWAEGWSTMWRLGLFPDKPTVMVNTNIAVSTAWTQDNIYVLGKPIYVTSGATLTIEPGTVVRGESQSATGANDPGTLIVTRGSKIQAHGTEDKPIVFTNLDDDALGGAPGTGLYSDIQTARSVTGTWGGVIILGRSYVANNTLAGPDPARFFQIEGLTPSGGLGLYGDCLNQGAFPDCDDDDSGTLTYASIRYGGFNLSDANEINGLTLGAVGRGTKLEGIEIFQNKDDGVEFFGGTAEVKKLLVYAVGDDSVDYDEGYRGKIQFGFAMQGLPGTDRSDKGAEQDGGNNPDGSRPFAIPTFYNMTFIGHDGEKNFTGSDLNTALHFRDNAGGRQYNSFYADFGGAPLLIEGGNLPAGSQTAANSSGERAITAYPGAVDPAFFTGPASDFQLELQDNTFWCIGAGGVVPSGDTTVWGGDAGKNHYNNGAFTNAALDNDYLACNTPLPILELTRELNLPTVPDPVLTVDPRPAPGSGLLVTDRNAPADGFFCAASYKGAFRATENWAAGWTNADNLGLFPKCDPINHPNVIPNPARNLDWPDKDTLVWKGPLGADFKAFDLLETVGTTSLAASDFSSATCEETNDTDLTAEIPADPAVNEVFFLLVRVNNNCGENLGSYSDGTIRVGPVCP